MRRENREGVRPCDRLRHFLLVVFTAFSVIAIAKVAVGQAPPDSFRSGLRGTTPLGEEGAPPRMTPSVEH